MKPEFILMLTYNDRTVEKAMELFEECKDTPVTHWGFKDVGLPAPKMKKLVKAMKQAGKTTFLEVVSLSEEEGLAGAKLAVEAGFDILMGTVFFDSIMAFLKDKPIKYYPFPGHVHSHPSILDGGIGQIVENARFLESKGVQGLDLLSYRYVGDAAPRFGIQVPGDLRSAVLYLIRNLFLRDPLRKTLSPYVSGWKKIRKLSRKNIDNHIHDRLVEGIYSGRGY